MIGLPALQDFRSMLAESASTANEHIIVSGPAATPISRIPAVLQGGVSTSTRDVGSANILLFFLALLFPPQPSFWLPVPLPQVSYSRKEFLQTGDGHFSPIGGFRCARAAHTPCIPFHPWPACLPHPCCGGLLHLGCHAPRVITCVHSIPWPTLALAYGPPWHHREPGSILAFTQSLGLTHLAPPSAGVITSVRVGPCPALTVTAPGLAAVPRRTWY